MQPLSSLKPMNVLPAGGTQQGLASVFFGKLEWSTVGHPVISVGSGARGTSRADPSSPLSGPRLTWWDPPRSLSSKHISHLFLLLPLHDYNFWRHRAS